MSIKILEFGSMTKLATQILCKFCMYACKRITFFLPLRSTCIFHCLGQNTNLKSGYSSYCFICSIECAVPCFINFIIHRDRELKREQPLSGLSASSTLNWRHELIDY